MVPDVQPLPAPYSAVLAWAAAHAGPPRVERNEAASGRVLAGAVIAPRAVPPYAQATIGGVALCAAATHGAAEYTPTLVPARLVQAGDALADDEDAVIPANTVDWMGSQAVIVTPVASGSGVCGAGGIIAAGAVVLTAGTVLGAAALAVLAAIGLARVELIRPPRVALLAGPALAPMLVAALTADGAIAETLPGPTEYGAEWARAGQFDAILAIGGLPGATLHCAATRPGTGAAFGDLDGVPAIVLPPDAEGALATYLLLARPVVRARAGLPHNSRQARLTAPVPSGLGWTELVWLRCDGDSATPAGAGLLAATAGAYTVIAAGSEGAAAGAMVNTWT